MTGACGSACFNDAQCGVGMWCNNLAAMGICQTVTNDGQPVPGGGCVAAIAARACASGVCTSNGALAGTCGIAPDGGSDAGDGGPAANDDAGDSGEDGNAEASDADSGDAGDATAGDASDAGDSTSPDASESGSPDASESGSLDASDTGDTGTGEAGDAEDDNALDAADTGPPDASDAEGPLPDNGPEASTPSAVGGIAGGGLSCSTSPPVRRSAGSSPIAMAMALLVLGARRRKRQA
jgi:hypothetical protein